MTKLDAKLPATTGIGTAETVQGLRPVKKILKPEELTTTLAPSSVNILIPTIEEDPNVASAVAGLVAPRQLGETSQAYEQRRAAVERMRGTPTPAFFGQAGD